MREEWTQDKLSSNTKQTLTNIFRELDSDHIQQAFDLHVTLVRNASSEVQFLLNPLQIITSCSPFRLLDLLWGSND